MDGMMILQSVVLVLHVIGLVIRSSILTSEFVFIERFCHFFVQGEKINVESSFGTVWNVGIFCSHHWQYFHIFPDAVHDENKQIRDNSNNNNDDEKVPLNAKILSGK